MLIIFVALGPGSKVLILCLTPMVS